jgi:large subunit ribosomal protein L24
MKIKIGDTVIVIAGSRHDKGKQGKVLQRFVEEQKVIIEGINLKKKVVRDTSGKKTLVDVEYPLHVSNVAFYDETSKKGSRLGSVIKDGKKVRVAKASGTELK